MQHWQVIRAGTPRPRCGAPGGWRLATGLCSDAHSAGFRGPPPPPARLRSSLGPAGAARRTGGGGLHGGPPASSWVRGVVGGANPQEPAAQPAPDSTGTPPMPNRPYGLVHSTARTVCMAHSRQPTSRPAPVCERLLDLVVAEVERAAGDLGRVGGRRHQQALGGQHVRARAVLDPHHGHVRVAVAQDRRRLDDAAEYALNQQQGRGEERGGSREGRAARLAQAGCGGTWRPGGGAAPARALRPPPFFAPSGACLGLRVFPGVPLCPPSGAKDHSKGEQPSHRRRARARKGSSRGARAALSGAITTTPPGSNPDPPRP